MTLSKLALRNMKRNMKSYFLYFFSMIFSIVIYYTFKAIQYNSQIEKAAEGSKKISGAFTTSSILLILFVAIFIIYSNGFFTRKRKKEVGLYSLLGVQKRQIAKMLCYENLLMGFIALAIGIVIGSGLSTLFIKLLLNLMGVDLAISFEVPIEAVLNTVLVFFCIILYTSFQGYLLIYRFKLIELFQAEKQGESIPKGSIVLAIIGLSSVGIGYYCAYNFISLAKSLDPLTLAILILVTTVGGTFILFHFSTVMLLRYMRNRKGSFYNGMNMVSTSQLLYRIKGNATSLATIATLCAVTICAIGISVSLYFNVGQMVEMSMPTSYAYKTTEVKHEKAVDDVLAKYKDKHPVKADLSINSMNIKGDIKSPEEINMVDPHADKRTINVISQSEYKRIAKKLDITDMPSLSDNEAVLVKAEQPKLNEEMEKAFKEFDFSYEGHAAVFTLNGKEHKQMIRKEQAVLPGPQFMSMLVVLPDTMYTEATKTGTQEAHRIIKVDNQKESADLTKEMKETLTGVEVIDFYSMYREGLEGSGLMIFIGSFLGLVFLLATGSIIYFKQLSEAEMDKGSYEVLRKIGVTRKEMKKSIGKQIAFIFVAPLLVAVLHSLFALNTAKVIFGLSDVTPILISSVIYCFIYLGYYVLTVRSYTSIVSNK
ncbi:ABC transporter permease [Priestia taiwanensis]|uniref:ABC transporter permease n=1 Tax=Priestia taiwanensis TaxID=1347902 RepID=A0A917AUD0_9BACI|nr:ABC transporter permease [Priestia taiwanensis]MBM7363542.1 putative ABC transport system permease protein [Priestia taiwanensis]GGE76267.1 ABC transporter permease [Priestia taiwanensis]